jgi:predicted Zn finger-like uncharacterized protein
MAGAGGGTTLDCPRCGTTYRLSGAQIAREEATYECAKCHEVFGPGVAEDDIWRDEPDEETFSFDDEAPTPPRATSGRARRAQAAAREGRGPVELEAADVDSDEDEEDVALDEDEEPIDVAPPRPRRRRSASTEDDEPASPGVARFALRALIAVTLSYAVVSVWASTHRDTFQRLLGRIPVVGSGLAESALDPSDVALRDVQGAYDYLTSGELAFVVRGTAANRSTDSLRRVRVEARVSGPEEQRQLASCTDAPTDVRKMSRQMLMLMENVRETRPAVVPAGGSAACEVVFVDPPHPIHELSLEVVSVLAN